MTGPEDGGGSDGLATPIRAGVRTRILDLRPTDREVARLRRLPIRVDFSRVRIHRGGKGPLLGAIRALVLSCSGGRAIALGNHVFVPDDCRDSLPVLAHELTHCGQYQAWGAFAYFARALTDRVRELGHRMGLGPSPYDYRTEPLKPFEQYGMEQQGQMVENWFRRGCPGRSPLTHSGPSAEGRRPPAPA